MLPVLQALAWLLTCLSWVYKAQMRVLYMVVVCRLARKKHVDNFKVVHKMQDQHPTQKVSIKIVSKVGRD